MRWGVWACGTESVGVWGSGVGGCYRGYGLVCFDGHAGLLELELGIVIVGIVGVLVCW